MAKIQGKEVYEEKFPFYIRKKYSAFFLSGDAD